MAITTNLKGAFRRNSGLFRRYILDSLSRSTEYQGIENQLDTVLLLADRVLVAFEEDLEFNQIKRIANALEQVNKAIANNHDEEERRAVETLMQSAEQWVKPLIWLINRQS